jgi:hypothetical protein
MNLIGDAKQRRVALRPLVTAVAYERDSDLKSKITEVPETFRASRISDVGDPSEPACDLQTVA